MTNVTREEWTQIRKDWEREKVEEVDSTVEKEITKGEKIVNGIIFVLDKTFETIEIIYEEILKPIWYLLWFLFLILISIIWIILAIRTFWLAGTIIFFLIVSALSE